MDSRILNYIIIGALIFLVFRMSKKQCVSKEGFENNYPIINDQPLREKLRKELVPQLQNIKTGFDTVFDSINNYLDMNKISDRVGCTKREQEVNMDQNGLQNSLKNLVDTKKAEYQSRIDEMVRQVEQMIIQY